MISRREVEHLIIKALLERVKAHTEVEDFTDEVNDLSSSLRSLSSEIKECEDIEAVRELLEHELPSLTNSELANLRKLF